MNFVVGKQTGSNTYSNTFLGAQCNWGSTRRKSEVWKKSNSVAGRLDDLNEERKYWELNVEADADGKQNSQITSDVPPSCIIPVSYTHLDVYKRQELEHPHDFQNPAPLHRKSES